ncbi:peptidoglycan-associated lipoprotein Pal [Thalassotalea agarivorans]|uniref:Peptidoglycan-associated lipoprotein n=1 Tax=Thalassotalea agarivorans TaxID=349064 RepID=A0A1I0GTZ5_THASX|nr:peptidoglycan-associated lipoprotein Pal [Thalassotalea agarivorans]SET74616.1 peptidoglycan-associated lipoprotein [Thalassotalea agarivorans]
MRLKETVKALAIALPVLALSACSSSGGEAESTATDTNATEQTVSAEEQARIDAAKREQEIEAQKQQQMEALQANHIVWFDFDQSTLTSESTKTLELHATYLSANTDVKVTVEGHADERGTPEYNIALGERRAKAVANYLQNLGVTAEQINVVSYGEEKPMVTDRTEAAFAKNRRAVIAY